MTMDAPNVLLIHCHDLGQYVGCYGVDIEMPNLDRLADEGARFANHFTTAPQCSPSRSSLFTGYYPHVNGLLGLAHTEWELDTEQTLSHRLSEAGYGTHLFGLQHISESPEDIGYNEIHTAGRLSPNVAPELHSVNRAADVADTLSQYLDSGLEPPFFASVGFFEAHRLEMDEVDEEEGDVLYGYGDRYDADDPDEIEVPGYLPDEPGIREDLAAMRGMVYALDDALGTILDSLESAGFEEETLVLFTTEHGIAFPRAKGTCYDPGIEAFLLARYPPLIDGGTVYEELVSNVDILPTVLDLATGETPDDIDGYSLVPLLDNDRMYSLATAYSQKSPGTECTTRFVLSGQSGSSTSGTSGTTRGCFSPTTSTRAWPGARSGAATGGRRGCTKNCTTSNLTHTSRRMSPTKRNTHKCEPN